MKKLFLIALFVLATISVSPPLLPAGDTPAPATTAPVLPPSQSVKVSDIDIGYRILGEGYPLILITGYGATMDMWDPLVIKELSSRYKVILFDNRGMAKTTASEKPFTIELFAEDTLGLMDVLKIRKAHVMGWSMGTFIATELTLGHPDRVAKLILYAGNCGWTGGDIVAADPQVARDLMDLSGTPEDRSRRLISILFPKKWLEDHPGFLNGLPAPEVAPSRQSVERQGEAIRRWAGACKSLPKIAHPTLVITGTEDVVIPPANSLLMATRIPGSWLIRMAGGHSTIYQYPRDFSRYLLTFLEEER